jgi:hypothetical protein
MIETLAALIFAHALADFVLQTNAMVASKHRARTMALHGLIVLGTAALATGTLSPWLLALTAAHLVIDWVKIRSNRTDFWPFMIDQAAHAATLIALALYVPNLSGTGLWAAYPMLPALMTIASGAILATRAGGFAIGLLMDPWAQNAPAGLPNGGRAIGTLERGLIFLLILTGQAQSIGFLIAAKSVLRFGSVSNEKEASEYVIIGTLASFSWAIAVSFATTALLACLPALGIPDLLP